jgi:hypothetical protein
LIVQGKIMTRRFTGPLVSLFLAASLPSSAAASDEPLAARENTIRALEEQERVAVPEEDVHALERLW